VGRRLGAAIDRVRQLEPGVSPTGDIQCVAGAATTGEPGALLRGGGWFDGTRAGPLAVAGDPVPSNSSDAIGFRCAR